MDTDPRAPHDGGVTDETFWRTETPRAVGEVRRSGAAWLVVTHPKGRPDQVFTASMPTCARGRGGEPCKDMLCFRRSCSTARHCHRGHVEHAVHIAKKALATYGRKHRPTLGGLLDPARLRDWDPSSQRRAWVKLDGDPCVDVVWCSDVIMAGRRPNGEPRYRSVTGRQVRCWSPRCVEDGRKPATIAEIYEGDGLSLAEVREMADEAAENHRRWHDETFGVHSRAALDRWIRHNAMLTAPGSPA